MPHIHRLRFEYEKMVMICIAPQYKYKLSISELQTRKPYVSFVQYLSKTMHYCQALKFS